MKICAIILNYFNWRDTVICVKSIVSQSVDRIVVLDNSGNEDEETALKKALEKYSCVEVTKTEANLGFAGGINYVLRRIISCEFDSFLILNNDTIAPEGLIQALIKGSETDSFDIAAPLIFHYPEKDRLWSRGYYYNKILGLVTRESIALLPHSSFFLSGCCLFVRREVFDTVGLFDESFFMYGEDIEFCCRAAQKGYRIGIVPEAKLYHRVSLSSQNNSLFYEYHMNRSHFLLVQKLFQTNLERKLSLVVKTLVMGIRATVRTCRYRNLNAIMGYKRALSDALFPNVTNENSVLPK